MAQEERLQKILAASGVASRRKSEEIIKEGRVTVNGVVVTELGTKAKYTDDIRVDGNQIAKEEYVYYVLYKPTGYLTTLSDDLGRRTVLDLFREEDKKNRIFPVGRLDYDSSGVLLLTNDGQLSAKLIKAANHVEKEYDVRIDGILAKEDLQKIRKGVTIDGVKMAPCYASVIRFDAKNKATSVKMILTEGKNREIRRTFESLGYTVKKLKRVRFANITLDGLAKGEYRRLKAHELKELHIM